MVIQKMSEMSTTTTDSSEVDNAVNSDMDNNNGDNNQDNVNNSIPVSNLFRLIEKQRPIIASTSN